MEVCQCFICFIFLTLQDGNTGLVNAAVPSYKEMEGGNITVECKFSLSGSRRLFCKGECKNGKILIDTQSDTAQNGSYSIKYIKNGFLEKDILNVSITRLKKSQSGQYSCCLDRSWLPDSCESFKIIVEVLTTPTPNMTLQPFPASTIISSASTPPPTTPATTMTATMTTTMTTTTKSSTPSSTSTETMKQPQIISEDSGVLLYVGPILVIMITFLSTAVVIFCKRRAAKPKGPPAETEYADITDPNRIDEDVRGGDRPNGSRPVEVSSVCTTVKCPQGDTVKSSDDYSLITVPQSKAKDELNEVDYSEVDFSHFARTSSSLCGNSDNVVYSTLQLDANAANHTKDSSPPLQSAVEKHQ